MATTRTIHPFFSPGLTPAQPLEGMLLPGDAPADPVAALTRRLAAGEEAAFREFHAQYFDRLHQFLLVVARGQEHEAREALQETLVRVARHARPFENEEAFWCWLKAVARNAARDGGRKRTRYTALLQNFARYTQPDVTAAPVDDDRLTIVIEECLGEFAPEDRALLQGKYLAGATVNELASQHDQTAKAIESRLARLRRELRERALAKLRRP